MNKYYSSNSVGNIGTWSGGTTMTTSSSSSPTTTMATTTITSSNNTLINEQLEEAIQQNYEVIESWIQSNQQHFSNIYDTLVYIYLDLENFRVSSVYRSHPTYKTSKKNQVGFTCIFSGIGKYTKLTQSTFYSPNNGITTYINPNISNYTLLQTNQNQSTSPSPNTSTSIFQSLNTYSNSSNNNNSNGNSGRESPANEHHGGSKDSNLYYNNFINNKNNIYDSAHFVLVHSINRALDKLINTILTHTLVYDQVISYKRGEGLDFPHIQLLPNLNFQLSSKQQQIQSRLLKQQQKLQQQQQQHLTQRQLFKLSNDSTGSDNGNNNNMDTDEEVSSDRELFSDIGSISSESSPNYSPILSGNSIHNIIDGAFDFSKKVYPPIGKRNILERSSTSPSLSASLDVLNLHHPPSTTLATATTTTPIVGETLSSTYLVSPPSIPSLLVLNNNNNNINNNSISLIPTPLSSSNSTTDENSIETVSPKPSIIQSRLIEISKEIGEPPSLSISETNDGMGSACISSLYGFDFEKKQQYGNPFADCFCLTIDAHPMIKAVLSIADGSGHGEDPKRAAQMSILGANQYIESLFDQDIPTTNDLLTVVGNSIFEGHKRIIEDEYYQNQEIHIEPRGATTFCIGVLAKSINDNLNNSLINSNSNNIVSLNNNHNNSSNSIGNTNGNNGSNNSSSNNTSNLNSTGSNTHVNHFKSYIKPSTQSRPRKNSRSKDTTTSTTCNTTATATVATSNEQTTVQSSGETSPQLQQHSSPIISSQRCLTSSSEPITIPFRITRSNSMDSEISSILSESPELIGASASQRNESTTNGDKTPRLLDLPSNITPAIATMSRKIEDSGTPSSPNKPSSPISQITTTPIPTKSTVPPKLPQYPSNENNNYHNNEINAPWVYVIGSVGDTKAFRWSHVNGKITEITNRAKNNGNSNYSNHQNNNLAFVHSQSPSSQYNNMSHPSTIPNSSTSSILSSSPTPSPTLLSSTPTGFSSLSSLGPRNFNEAGGQLGWMWGGDQDRSWPIDAPSYPKSTGQSNERLKEELLKARNEKCKPLLTNLHFAMALVSPGDRIFIVSDGVSDNFLNFEDSSLPSSSSSTSSSKIKSAREQIEENMTVFLNDLPKESISSCELMSQSIVTYCIEKTETFRTLQEEISKLLLKMKEIEKTPELIKDPLYQSYKKQHSQKTNALRKIKIGKPDHSSIVIYEVPNE